MISIVSWNVAGLRAIKKKESFDAFLKQHSPDILCLQETKLSQIDAAKIFESLADQYPYAYLHPCILEKLKNNGRTGTGYSGTAILSKIQPIRDISKMFHNMNIAVDEGRITALEYDTFVIVSVYTPNSGSVLERLGFRVDEWDRKFEAYMIALTRHFPSKHIIIAGDLNCAHNDIDIHSPSTNKKSAGFTPQERESFGNILERTCYCDVFRDLYPRTVKYTYWSNFNKSREKNKGWRIDYILVHSKNNTFIKDADILDSIMGSDHCPIRIRVHA
jgi:exodeoxyribonuclease III